MRKLRLIAVLALFGVFAFTVIRHYQSSTEKRTKATLEYLDRFKQAPLQEARSRPDKFWDKRSDAVRARTSAGDKAFANYVVKLVYQFGLTDDSAVVVEFYDDLYDCTCAKSCDQASATHWFAKYAHEFHTLMSPYLDYQRRRLARQPFGRGVESFARTQAAGSNGAALSCQGKTRAAQGRLNQSADGGTRER